MPTSGWSRRRNPAAQPHRWMQEIKKMKRSSLVLLFITLWWVIPFFVRDLLAYSFIPYFTSHLLYLVTIAISIVCAITLGFIDGKKDLWNRYEFWGKYLIVIGAYAAQIILIFFVIIFLGSNRLLKYYGGDPEGSVGMLFFPSIVFYLVIGGVLGIIAKAIKWIRKRIQP